MRPGTSLTSLMLGALQTVKMLPNIVVAVIVFLIIIFRVLSLPSGKLVKRGVMRFQAIHP